MDIKIIKAKQDFSSVLYFLFIALIIMLVLAAFKSNYYYIGGFFLILLIMYIYDMPITKVILFEGGIKIGFLFFTKSINLSDIKSYNRKKKLLKIKANGMFYSNIKLKNFHTDSLDEIEKHLQNSNF